MYYINVQKVLKLTLFHIAIGFLCVQVHLERTYYLFLTCIFEREKHTMSDKQIFWIISRLFLWLIFLESSILFLYYNVFGRFLINRKKRKKNRPYDSLFDINSFILARKISTILFLFTIRPLIFVKLQYNVSNVWNLIFYLFLVFFFHNVLWNFLGCAACFGNQFKMWCVYQKKTKKHVTCGILCLISCMSSFVPHLS